MWKDRKRSALLILHHTRPSEMPSPPWLCREGDRGSARATPKERPCKERQWALVAPRSLCSSTGRGCHPIIMGWHPSKERKRSVSPHFFITPVHLSCRPPPDFAGKGTEAAPGPLQRSDPAKRGSGHWSPLVIFAVVRAVGATPSSWGGTLQRQGCWGKRIWGGQGQGGGGTGNGGVEGWGDEGSNQCQSQSLFKRGTLHYQLPTTNVYLVVN